MEHLLQLKKELNTITEEYGFNPYFYGTSTSTQEMMRKAFAK